MHRIAALSSRICDANTAATYKENNNSLVYLAFLLCTNISVMVLIYGMLATGVRMIAHVALLIHCRSKFRHADSGLRRCIL